MRRPSLTFDENDVTPVHDEREILERVRARGTTLRRRKVFARAASAVTVVVVLVGGIAFAYQGGGPKLGPLGAPSAPVVTDLPSRAGASPTVAHSTEASASDTPSEQPSPSAPVC